MFIHNTTEVQIENNECCVYYEYKCQNRNAVSHIKQNWYCIILADVCSIFNDHNQLSYKHQDFKKSCEIHAIHHISSRTDTVTAEAKLELEETPQSSNC